MVKEYSDSQRGNPLLPLHGLFFLINGNEREKEKRQRETEIEREREREI